MGLNEGSNEKRTYINIVNGKFAKRVPEGTEKSVEREYEYPKGTKKLCWELLYKSLDGMIKNVEIKEGGDFGDQLLITMEDVGDVFIVNLGLASREAKNFLMVLPNINLNASVTLSPYNYIRKKDDKKLIGLGVNQIGEKEKIPYAYSKESGMPWGGEEQMDKDEFKILMAQQTIFLKKKTKAFIAEHFASAEKPAENNEPHVAVHTTISTAPEPVDDLPF